MTSAEEILAKVKKPKTTRVRLLFDADLVQQHADLDVELLDADDDEGALSLAQQIVDLEAEMKAAETEFVQQGIGRTAWRSLASEYPSEDGKGWDPNEFPFQAMSRSLVEPLMTPEQLKELAEHLPIGDFGRLWDACLDANVGGGVTRPESLAAHALLANGRHKSAQPSD